MSDSACDALQQALAPVIETVRLRQEIVEPDDSYWFHRPARNFPPKALRDPALYDGGDRLALSITQTGLPAAEQKALVHEWCSLLPTLHSVRTLWFHSKVSQEMFEAACAMPGLEGLYVKWSTVESLRPVAALGNLRYFHLGGAPSAEHLSALAQLPHLIDLEILKVRAAGDLEFVRDLTGLRALLVGGDTNSNKAFPAKSLAPLACLGELERLNLVALHVEDPSLAPLAELPRLRYLGLSNRFPMEEFARLAGRRPDIACDRFVASWPLRGVTCKKCRQETLHLLTGKGTAGLCSVCDAPRLARHVEAFERLKGSGRLISR